jgi:sec-independent protein translocase protein TatA
LEWWRAVKAIATGDWGWGNGKAIVLKEFNSTSSPIYIFAVISQTAIELATEFSVYSSGDVNPKNIVSSIVRNEIMNFFGIGLPETIAIAVVVLLVFGPKKLPEIGKSLGKAIKGFQEASNDFQSEFKKEVDAIESAVKTPSQIESSEAVESKSDRNT